MGTHTPGPWSYGDDRTVYAAKGGRLVTVAEVFSGHCAELSEAEANQALIAAAPEMFAALSDLVVAIERAAENGIDLTGHVGLGDAFAAIRKAQGRG